MIAYVEAIAWYFGGFLEVVDQKYEGLVVHGRIHLPVSYTAHPKYSIQSPPLVRVFG